VKIGVPCFGGDAGRSGIGRYIVQLLRGFAAMDGDDVFECPVHASEAGTYIPSHERLIPLPVGERVRNPVLNVAWHQVELPIMCRRRGWDAMLLPAGNRRLPARAPCPTVGVVHDMSSAHMTGKYDPAREFYIRHVLPFLFRRQAHVITPSTSTMNDVVDRAGVPQEQVTVIPHGVDHELFRPIDPDTAQRLIAERYDLKPPWILYVSRIEHPGKNHCRLIRAFEKLKSTGDVPLQLVLAGSDWTRANEVHETAFASP